MNIGTKCQCMKILKHNCLHFENWVHSLILNSDTSDLATHFGLSNYLIKIQYYYYRVLVPVIQDQMKTNQSCFIDVNEPRTKQ